MSEGIKANSNDSFRSPAGRLDVNLHYEAAVGLFEPVDKELLDECLRLSGELAALGFALIAASKNQAEADRALGAIVACKQLLVIHRDARDTAREKEGRK